MKFYTSYACRSCKKEFILLSEDISKLEKNRYITCPYCNSKNIREETVSDTLKECMQERCYKRHKGALKQVR